MLISSQIFDILKLLLSEEYKKYITNIDCLMLLGEYEFIINIIHLINIKVYYYNNVVVFVNLSCSGRDYVKITIEFDEFENIDRYFYKIKSTIDTWLNETSLYQHKCHY